MNRLDLTLNEIIQIGSNGENLEESLRKIYDSTPLGPIDENLINSIYGINHRQIPLSLPMNRDVYGLTFFTRPNLNLTSDNLRYVRQMYPLLNKDNRSIQRIIRCLLDPNLQKNIPYYCPFVDEFNIFIPMLTNLCLTISGWPDYVVDTKTTPEGHFRESHSMVDSPIEIKNTYELSASFRNIPGNPITLLFYFWIFYAAKVFEGELMPYGSAIWSNEIDYNTRIYRLILDPSKKYVQHIISTGASFPLNSPVGALGNFDSSQPFNDANDNVNIRFQCIGMDYNDPVQIKEFNEAVAILNEDMDSGMPRNIPKNGMIKIPYSLLNLFNMNGYPRINRETMELEWWISGNVLTQHKLEIDYFIKTLTNDPGTFMTADVKPTGKYLDVSDVKTPGYNDSFSYSQEYNDRILSDVTEFSRTIRESPFNQSTVST